MNLFRKKRPEGRTPADTPIAPVYAAPDFRPAPMPTPPAEPPIAPVYAAPEVLSGQRPAPRPVPDYPQSFAVPEPPRYVCPACGAFVEPHFNFCPICGVRLDAPREWHKPQPEPPDSLTSTVYAAPDFWDKKG